MGFLNRKSGNAIALLKRLPVILLVSHLTGCLQKSMSMAQITARMVKSQLERMGILATCKTIKNNTSSKIKAAVSSGSFPTAIAEEQRLIGMGYTFEFYGICHENNLSPTLPSQLPSQMKVLHSLYLYFD